MCPIDREHWKRIEPLLDRALEMPVEERKPWLTKVCADDPALAADVARLLATDGMAARDGFLDTPPIVRRSIPIMEPGTTTGDETSGNAE